MKDFFNIIYQILPGIKISLLVFFATIVFSIPLGVVVYFARASKIKIVALITRLYISVMRGTPLMLQLMIVYFGPYYIFGIKITSSYRIIATLLGFTINYAAYFAEIYRGGIEAIPRGQYEAAQILGYTKVQTFIRIIVPQVVKIILPSITNEIVTIVKDTSLAYVLAVTEMFAIARQIATNMASMFPYLVAGICYYFFSFIVEILMGRLEKKLNYFR